MSQPDLKIKELEDRLDRLVRTQVGFQTEVRSIREELARLRSEQAPVVTRKLDGPLQGSPAPPAGGLPEKSPITGQAYPQREPLIGSRAQAEVKPPTFSANYQPAPERQRSALEENISAYFSQYAENARANLEKFIGENLISKIGIVVLILGVGIFGKYAIDNDLISPLTRVVLGYIVGFGLLGFAAKLKSKYHDFSAVLLSGGMAIMYFITYFAYSSYQLIHSPQRLL